VAAVAFAIVMPDVSAIAVASVTHFHRKCGEQPAVDAGQPITVRGK
jgi:hypothetical protein